MTFTKAPGLELKKTRKKRVPLGTDIIGQSIYVEGNNGGDYLKFAATRDGRLYLEVGHCCVVTVQKILPAEMLTSLLTSMFEKPQWPLPWGSKFNSQILSKVEDAP